MSLCAACGRKGHRYGRNEGMERFNPQACINGLIGENEQKREAIGDLLDELADTGVDTTYHPARRLLTR